MTFEEWNDKHWKVNVRERDGEKSYALNAPSTTYIFNEHDLLQLAHNINSIAEHIYDNEFYYIHDGNIFKRTGGQLFGVIDDCEELNRLHNENERLKSTIKKLEAQLYKVEDGVCDICNNMYLVQQDRYFVSKCKKGHEECSKMDLEYCDDFELKDGDVE